jgi:hypothetical protein
MQRALRRETSRQGVTSIEIMGVAEAYLLHHPAAGCPTLDVLADSRLLARSASRSDPWGADYTLSCEAGDVNVRSTGPDGAAGTDDDISMF